jgi:hypothetical protein
MHTTVSTAELISVIQDFLEMGHVDNIVAMFAREPHYYGWTGEILDDERFNVRLGVLILFETLKERQPEHLERALDSLLPLLKADQPHIRGEAVSVLGIIDTPKARTLIRGMSGDSHPLVREVVADILDDMEE